MNGNSRREGLYPTRSPHHPGAPRATPATCLLTIWLAQGMEDMQVHGPVQGADEECLIGAGSLVGSVNGLCLPVSPVDIVLKQGQCKDMWDVLAQHCGVGGIGQWWLVPCPPKPSKVGISP